MKKLLKITLALMMALCLQLTSFNSVHALNNDLSKAGTYQVPIKSLESAAPISAVQTAFARSVGFRKTNPCSSGRRRWNSASFRSNSK